MRDHYAPSVWLALRLERARRTHRPGAWPSSSIVRRHLSERDHLVAVGQGSRSGRRNLLPIRTDPSGVNARLRSPGPASFLRPLHTQRKSRPICARRPSARVEPGFLAHEHRRRSAWFSPGPAARARESRVTPPVPLASGRPTTAADRRRSQPAADPSASHRRSPRRALVGE